MLFMKMQLNVWSTNQENMTVYTVLRKIFFKLSYVKQWGQAILGVILKKKEKTKILEDKNIAWRSREGWGTF